MGKNWRRTILLEVLTVERLTIQQLIDRYDNKLYEEPSGSEQYREHYSVRVYLQWLQHFMSLGVPFHRLRVLAEADRLGELAIFPCRVGAPVYVIDSGRKGAKVRATRINGFLYDGHQIEVCVAGSGSWYRMGEEAFLTPDQAERALRGGK